MMSNLYWIRQRFKATVLNWALPSFHGESFEITFEVFSLLKTNIFWPPSWEGNEGKLFTHGLNNR